MPQLLVETDQTLCYDESGRVIDCQGSGQDAARPKAANAGGGRFHAQGGIVRDSVTGLIWTKNANPADFPLTFAEGRAFVRSMSQREAHGYAGWQIPSRRELFSLVSHQEAKPALAKDHPFENVFSGYYWSSDLCHRLPEQAWRIDMGGGRVPKANKTDVSLVWPVCLPDDGHTFVQTTDRFMVKGDVVRDTATNRVWAREADIAGKQVTWKQALHMASALNDASFGGRKGWRLPGIRELESLVDLSNDSPALPGGHPFMNVRDFYWSSTTSVYEPRYAWALYFRDGFVGVGFKPDAEFFFWPVCDI